jgi:hypothetical protein
MHHDMGGEPAGPVSTAQHDLAPWEKRIEAVVRCMNLGETPLVTVDELRRGIEELPPHLYDTLSYYERWIASLANIMVEKGVLTRPEIDARMAAIAAARRKDAP